MGFSDAELLAAYPRIYSFAVSMVRDTTYAEDIAQETVLRMIRRRQEYERRETGLASWGCKIAQNWFYDQRELLWLKMEVNGDWAEFAIRSTATKPEAESRETLRDCLGVLDKCNGSGEALLMFALGDGHDEIAQAQGIAVNTVKTRVIRTREKLERHFGIERKSRRSARRTSKRKACATRTI